MSAIRRFHFIFNCYLFRITWGRSEGFVYSYSSLLYSRATHTKKFWTHELPKRKIFGPTKHPPEKISDPRITHEKIFRVHEITRRKNLEPTKYSRVKISNPLKNNGTMARDPRDTLLFYE